MYLEKISQSSKTHSTNPTAGSRWRNSRREEEGCWKGKARSREEGCWGGQEGSCRSIQACTGPESTIRSRPKVSGMRLLQARVMWKRFEIFHCLPHDYVYTYSGIYFWYKASLLTGEISKQARNASFRTTYQSSGRLRSGRYTTMAKVHRMAP